MARAASTTATPRKSAAGATRGSRKAAVAEATPPAAPTPPSHAVLRMETEMTVVHAAAQREQILAAVQAAPQGLEIDLSAVEGIDSAGIQLLLAARHSLQRHAAPLSFSGAVPAVSEALGVYGLKGLLVSVDGAHAQGARA